MSNKSGSQWISLSDMMTGLMLVFLFITVLFIAEFQKKEVEKNSILIEYNNSRKNIYEELKNTFEKNKKDWQMSINDDLSIKFNNLDILFEVNKSELKPGFEEILDKFIPKYLEIITNKKFSGKIKGVFIEGHASGKGCRYYLSCLKLSQERANSVLSYILNSKYFNNLPEEDKKMLEFSFISSGLSNGKSLDKNGNFTYKSKLEVDDVLSRRVEFRIITNSDDLVDNLLKNLDK